MVALKENESMEKILQYNCCNRLDYIKWIIKGTNDNNSIEIPLLEVYLNSLILLTNIS